MNTLTGLIAVWVAIIHAGFLFGLADGAAGVKALFIVGILGILVAMRPHSTQSWQTGLNR